MRSASALDDSSHGSKPRSSSCGSHIAAEVEAGPLEKPKAACQSVVLDTGMVSGISVVEIPSAKER